MILIYRENGWVAKVDLITKTEKEDGESFKLKVLETYQLPFFLDPNGIPQQGEEFTVWRAQDAGPYAGWFLSESLI